MKIEKHINKILRLPFILAHPLITNCWFQIVIFIDNNREEPFYILFKEEE